MELAELRAEGLMLLGLAREMRGAAMFEFFFNC